MAEDRRHPHRGFDTDLISTFLRGRGVAQWLLLSEGRSNSSYKITLDDGSVYVVRLRSGGDAAREAYIMGLAREVVPVPLEVARGGTWSVFEFMEGEPLAERPQDVGAAAETLARIASVRFASAGWIETDGSVKPFEFGGLPGFALAMTARADVQGWLGRDLLGGLSRLLDRQAGRISEMGGDNCLVHGDFNPRNILVRDGKVSAVLDWEFSHAGTPYMDVGNLLRHLPERWMQIEAGLRAGGMELPEDWRERADLVDLTSQLEFLTSGRADTFKRECVERVRRTVEALG